MEAQRRAGHARNMALLLGFLLIANGCSLANNATAPATRSQPTTNAPPASASQSYAVLFDASHAETAGNADWVISTSQPDPLRENARPRDEADWTGALSAWGVALQQTGRYRLMTLPRGGDISFGDQANPLDLGGFDVFVVPEPNTSFSDDEKRAIMLFVQQGGGLFMIANHDNSDRNNDGVDSLAIWNDLMRDNPVASGDPFGFSFDTAAISRDNPRSIRSTNDPILDGPFGNVSGSILRDGTTATLHPQNNPDVRGLLYLSQADRRTNDVFLLTSTFGRGRVAAWGDSSPIDDGTGAPGERLFDGWNDPAGSNAALALNATEWLAGGEQSGALASTPLPQGQPTSAPAAGRQFVRNGDFEAGLDGWRVSQSAGRSLLGARQAHSGSNAAILCGVDNCDDTLAQTLQLPKGAATLRFFVLIDTQEQGRAFDFLTVELRDASGQRLAQLVRLSNTNAGGDWREYSTDLSAFAGRTVELVFVASSGKLKPTEFVVDDVGVTVK